MRSLVVFESMFGNTEKVARAVAEGLAEWGSVDVAEVGTRPCIDPGLDLVVVGGPTHAFGMTRPSTRESAREQAPDGHVVSEGDGVREWLAALPTTPLPTVAAAFDTRVAPARVPGSAAKGITKRLKGRCFARVLDTRTFWVAGTPGPLLDGQLHEAREWGRGLGAALGTSGS